MLLREARGSQPFVDALHHVSRSKISRLVGMEVRPIGGSLQALGRQVRSGQAQTLGVPFAQAFLEKPKADDVLEESDAARDAALVGETRALPPPLTTG